MEIFSLEKIICFSLLLDMVRGGGCRCLNQAVCHCEGSVQGLAARGPTLHSLSLENGNFTNFIQNSLHYYKEGLVDLTITRSQELEEIGDSLLRGMPSLNYLRVSHTSLRYLPKLENLGMSSTMRIIDFESNKILRIQSNAVRVRTAQLSLDYNFIRSVDGWAFNGSEIENLSLKGNLELTDLSPDSFSGIQSLRFLDLSETSIQLLPTRGLENLEILKITNTFTLKVIPSIYFLKKLQKAQLTYSFHCCAFHNPEKHDPVGHQNSVHVKSEICTRQCKISGKEINSSSSYNFSEYLRLRSEHCPEDEESRAERDMYDETFGEFLQSSNDTALSHRQVLLEGTLMNERLEEMEYEDNTEETFHQTTAELTKTGKIHAICGNLTGKFVSCVPKADALNPCEDLMGWNWLRISIWFVLSTAIFGNITVLVVLCLSRTEKTVPRYLMCNLAFADLLMAGYLAMLAVADLLSTDAYFNFAYHWQRGIGCKIAGFLTVFSSQLSLFTLSLLTVERWFAIRHALYLNLMNLRVTRSIMMAGWMYSIFMATLPLFGVSSYSSTSICLPMETEDMSSQLYIVAMISIGGFSFLLMSVCYVQIYWSLSEETRHSIGEGSVARKMTILVGTNFLCWAPVAFFTLTAVAGYPLITVSQSKILLVFIYPINSCANPYLYAILTQQFRKDFMILISRYLNRKKTHHYKMGYVRPTRMDASNDTSTRLTQAETLL